MGGSARPRRLRRDPLRLEARRPGRRPHGRAWRNPRVVSEPSGRRGSSRPRAQAYRRRQRYLRTVLVRC
jgi:hypothetical protein